MIFVAHMLPLFSSDGAPLDIKAVLGGRLGHWYLDMKANDPVFKRVLHPPAVLRVSRMASWLEGPER
jgi:hypothetical protein